MFNGIISLVGGFFQIIGNWMIQRGTPKNIEARVIDDERKKNDDFRNALKNKEIDKVRRGLSDGE